MIVYIQLLAILACLMLMAAIIELIRRHRLEEKYAIVWLLTSLLLIVFSLNVEILQVLSRLTGVITAPNFLFLLAFFFLVVISLSLTIEISAESKKNRRLAQELSILKFTLNEMAKKLNTTDKKSSKQEDKKAHSGDKS